MCPVTTLSEKLLCLAKSYLDNKKKLSDKDRELIKNLQEKELASFKLLIYDIIIIAVEWHAIAKGEHVRIDPIELLNNIYDDPVKSIKKLDRIIALLKKGIFDCEYKRVLADETSRNVKIKFSKEELFENDIFFSKQFLKKLVSSTNAIIDEDNKPYQNNKEFVTDWITYVDAVKDLSLVKFAQTGEDYLLYARDEIRKVSKSWKRIESKLKITSKKFPFMSLIDEYQLDHNEQIIIMYLLKEEMGNAQCTTEELTELISKDRYDVFRNKVYFQPNSNLVQNGLIEIMDMMFFKTSCDIRLCPDTTRRILYENPTTDKEKLKEILRGNDMFSLVEPVQTINDLILPDELKSTLLTGIKQYKTNVNETLKKWEICDSDIKEANSAGLLMLLYGPPGTGKTFCAGAIANKLKKQLLTTDISKILSCWVGDSEKNVRRLFGTYERIIKQLKNPPVLLLNEADQFLTKRGQANRSVDRMYNQMQNLFLEAFENLKGVLICTTNLRENFDPAFSRRFHLKLEFPMPGIKEREQLWRLHLPESIPGADKIDIQYLAREYELSGGQIAIIIKNAATRAASRNVKNRRLLLDDLKYYCSLEIDSMFERKKYRIGFKQ